ncbi:MAG TPA: cytochrome d ubiquinol oxidase subunit II [Acidimicrobiia bacterium]|nr:cytochrome d ubiquinol oxidase subunit II [Acidimicrobiia bacterium]
MDQGILNLETLWFVLIGVLWTGFFFLEGFDFGVGILLPFIGKKDEDRRVMINTIGPTWDGNEVWLLTAGGAMFAAFPEWYATMFSGFYLALLLILFALIVRGVAFEYRSKNPTSEWRTMWDWAIFIGSFLPALLFGVAFGNLVRGLQIDAAGEYVGGFWALLNPYALVMGITSLVLFTLHGSLFLSLKAKGVVYDRAVSVAKPLSIATTVVLALAMIWSYALSEGGAVPGLLPIVAIALLGAVIWLVRSEMFGWAFALTGVTIATVMAAIFIATYPNVMTSTIDPDYSLTVFNASSSAMTLKIMSVVALIFVPIVLGYQTWSYWVFRKRIGREDVTTAAH